MNNELESVQKDQLKSTWMPARECADISPSKAHLALLPAQPGSRVLTRFAHAFRNRNCVESDA